MSLTKKQYRLISGLTILTAVWTLFAFVITPALGRIDTLNRVIPEKQNTLRQLKADSEKYDTLKSRLDNLKQTVAVDENEFEILAFVERISADHGLTQKVASMRQSTLPADTNCSEIIVETRLRDITLRQLIDFLLTIKTSDHFVRIKSLYTQKNPANPNLLDSVIQVSTFRTY